MTTFLRFLKPVAALALVAALAIAVFMTRDRWLPLLQKETPALANDSSANDEATASPITKIVLTDQAIDNLGLTAKPAKPQTYWKTIQVPGMVIDRPGRSDLGIVSPVAGVMSQINFFPGDTVQPGDVLFTIRLLSETLHETQADLSKAVQELQLAQATVKRLKDAGGAIPQARIIEAESQVTRLEMAIQSHRLELSNRGLSQAQIDEVAKGSFVKDVQIAVPSGNTIVKPLTNPVILQTASEEPQYELPTFEVEESHANLGQQVEAGELLCVLANHQLLSIEGRAFRDETLLLERSVREGWPVDVDFQESAAGDWPPHGQTFGIRRIANTIDPVNRTFGFRIPLENQSRVVKHEEGMQILWRFRPGQKVRILVRVEKLDNVFILPSDAVTRDVAEAFVFTQNVNTFERKPVRILSQDRQYTVVANDGSFIPGTFVVENAAAQLNRMTKSQTGNDLPEGYHIHADGSLHKNKDEGN